MSWAEDNLIDSMWMDETDDFAWEDDIPVASELTPMDPEGRTCVACGNALDIYEAEFRFCEACAEDLET